MRTSIVTAFLIALGLSAIAAATLYARPAQGADTGPKADAVSGAAVTKPANQASPGIAVSPQPAVTPAPADPLTTGGDLIQAVRSGQWRLAASLALALLMLLLGKARNASWSPFKGDRGGAILVGLLAFAGALSTALATSAPLDWKLLLGTMGVLWTAVGGYTWIKRIIWPAPATPVVAGG